MPTPKSKDAKRKIRRWGYQIRAVMGEKEGTFLTPAVSIGTAHAAREMAKAIKKDYAANPMFEGATIHVEPQPHETISQVIVDQLNGLSDENKLLIRTIKNLVTSQVATPDPAPEGFNLEDAIKEGVGKAIGEARQQMIEERQAKVDAAAKELGGEAILAGEAEALALPDAPEAPLPMGDEILGEAEVEL